MIRRVIFGVTRSASTQNLVMIHLVYKQPPLRRVALFAALSGCDMAKRISGVMTAGTGAIAGNTAMIKRARRFPNQGTVAVLAIIAARYMSRRFTGGIDAIMTA